MNRERQTDSWTDREKRKYTGPKEEKERQKAKEKEDGQECMAKRTAAHNGSEARMSRAGGVVGGGGVEGRGVHADGSLTFGVSHWRESNKQHGM